MLQTDIFTSEHPSTSPLLQPLPEREKEYSPSSAIGGNYQPFIQAYIDQSKQAHNQIKCIKDLRYGAAERALIDYFPSPKNTNGEAPGLLVFIHGGYWQELSKNESAFLAPAWHAAGFAHAVVGYTLAPQARVGEIMVQCCAALAYLRDEAAQLGHDPNRIVVAGSSAGGYLTAACAADASLNLLGMVPISGIFDLRPLVGTSINDALGMSMKEAAELSALTKSASLVPGVIAWGQIETAAFKQQSKALASHLRANGQACETLEIAGRNHFDVVHELGDPQSALFVATRKLFDRQG
ncbi:alpha/beta hydrolase [Variovorax sp. PCZ-1]|uniref:alpha/beta hydrolase n=1 Tax=Variovorax sp. PCZ-1 TaxID=2835533 RepID=UPI001BCBAE68|nr:alpha/beta hydrolase [Variovorax sp. PCZ-1]MBS7806305.1 alpha/beta hydrolase [Variovorax sp. PCZ-1]